MQALELTPRRLTALPTATRIRSAIRAHRLAAYLALAFGLSGSYWTAMAVSGRIVTPGGTVSHFPGLFGPLVAAFAITALADGMPAVRDLARRMFRWRVAPRWYAVAFIPSALFLAGIAVAGAAGAPMPDASGLQRYSGLPEMALPVVALFAFLANGFGEEVGWRGFAHPTLRRDHGFLGASVAVAAAWALWHVPSFPVIETYRLMGLAIVPVFVIGLGSGAIVFGWLYERAGNSILIVALAHLSLNMATATEAGRGLPQMLVTSGIVVWAALIVAAELRRTGGLRRRFSAVGRGLTVRLLRSRPGARLVRTTTVVTYRGRTSGRTLSTPVEYVRAGSRVTILVASPERKQWWRNVRENSDVTLWLDGADHRGRASVSAGRDAQQALAGYLAERPRAARAAAGAVAVIVEVADAGR